MDIVTNAEVFRTFFDLENDETSRNLKAHFGRVRKGNPVEYRTRFYNPKHPGTGVPKLSLQEVLDRWIPALEPLKAKFPGLYKFEMDLAKKVGPLSIMKPLKERESDIESYYESILLDSTPISAAALEAVCREWRRVGPLQLRSQDRVVDVMKKSTNSGSPFYAKRRDVIGKTVPGVVFPNELGGKPSVIQELPSGTFNACAVLGWRGQEGGPSADDVKQRVVFMFPMAVNISEHQFYQAMKERAQALNLVPAWVSLDNVDAAVTRMFDTKSKNDKIVCTDFTKFDQHFNPSLQNAARYIISSLLDKSEASKVWLRDVFPIKYEIPLAIDWNTLVFGHHGMGSGSSGTNDDETMVHRALQYEAAMAHRKILNPNSMCLGDDGILTYPGITAKDVTDSYTRHGLEMNLSKQEESTHECTYLRRWHSTYYRVDGVCVGVYSTCRALGRLAEQERYYDEEIWGPEMVALRQLSILENCKYHPLREEFVQYCMKGDKFRLGLDIPGFFDKLDKLAKQATDIMPDFLGYTKSQEANPAGINTWWVVKYLKSQRA